MRFTKLRLNGFKSFVDPTDLVIAQGLTGVVGPNGCGKSNLLEALRWVMGENRPKAMRGGGMEDVIFAGAATRPARHFAEVTLHVDNSERLAPLEYKELDQFEITRRITRDIGSAYKAAGKDVRARDVQMLFADASTGAHSPALVRQGQISELINAKPKARRRVLEEAAGISGLYQRRHEAELKLNGAEQNLARVDDVIEQLAGQLATLDRQAKQAARYRDIARSLRQAEGILLFRRWRTAQEAIDAAQQQLGADITAAAAQERVARQMTSARAQADEALPKLREDEAIAAAILQRYQVERDGLAQRAEAAKTRREELIKTIEQLVNDAERERSLSTDAAQMIERLNWEKTQLNNQQETATQSLASATSLAHSSVEKLSALETALSERNDAVARLSARHLSAQRLIDDMTKSRDRAAGDATTARHGVVQADTAAKTAAKKKADAQDARDRAQSALESAEHALIAAEAGRADAQAAEAEARAIRADADGTLSTLKAETAALENLVKSDTSPVAQALDLVSVQRGYEVAFGAALAEDLRAPIAETADQSGWHNLPDYDLPQDLSQSVPCLAKFVQAPQALSRRLAQIGIVEREQAPTLQQQLRPGQRLVSLTGDLWRWDGFVAYAADAPNTAALKLEQRNRLIELQSALAEAQTKSASASARFQARQEELRSATQRDREAREARKRSDHSLAQASRGLSQSEAEQAIASGKCENARMAVERFEAEVAQFDNELNAAIAAQESLPDLDALRAGLEHEKTQVENARSQMLSAKSALEEHKRREKARTRRAQEITKELSGWRHRQDTAGLRIDDLAKRQQDAQQELDTLHAVPDALDAQRATLQQKIDAAQTRKQDAAEALARGEAAAREAAQNERETERAASEAREIRARSEARLETAQENSTEAAARIQEALELEPQDLLETLDIDPDDMPEIEKAEADVTRLRRQREALGAVNLRAEEDAKEVRIEHDQLKSEKADLEAAIKALRDGIAGLNKEGRARLLSAFDEVNENFAKLFAHLFGGGEAKLVLVESDDPLEAGLEIMCQPPGKKLSTLSLLSGGEQTLTALALIFGVFLANPAPICVLDEVDAPLDDANVNRFCDLLDEMTRQTDTRFLIITHHAVTMARMDRLFGVTMGEQGVSQLVSVDLKSAERMVA